MGPKKRKIPAKFPPNFPPKNQKKNHRRASAGVQGELLANFQVWPRVDPVFGSGGSSGERVLLSFRLSDPISRDTAILSLQYPISRDTLREVSTPPKWCDTPHWYLVLHRHIRAIPHFATYRAIIVRYPIKTTGSKEINTGLKRACSSRFDSSDSMVAFYGYI